MLLLPSDNIDYLCSFAALPLRSRGGGTAALILSKRPELTLTACEILFRFSRPNLYIDGHQSGLTRSTVMDWYIRSGRSCRSLGRRQ